MAGDCRDAPGYGQGAQQAGTLSGSYLAGIEGALVMSTVSRSEQALAEVGGRIPLLGEILVRNGRHRCRATAGQAERAGENQAGNSDVGGTHGITPLGRLRVQAIY